MIIVYVTVHLLIMVGVNNEAREKFFMINREIN